MTVDQAAAAGHATYDGGTYYFCGGHCRDQFTANPASFARQRARS